MTNSENNSLAFLRISSSLLYNVWRDYGNYTVIFYEIWKKGSCRFTIY